MISVRSRGLHIQRWYLAEACGVSHAQPLDDLSAVVAAEAIVVGIVIVIVILVVVVVATDRILLFAAVKAVILHFLKVLLMLLLHFVVPVYLPFEPDLDGLLENTPDAFLSWTCW